MPKTKKWGKDSKYGYDNGNACNVFQWDNTYQQYEQNNQPLPYQYGKHNGGPQWWHQRHWNKPVPSALNERYSSKNTNPTSNQQRNFNDSSQRPQIIWPTNNDRPITKPKYVAKKTSSGDLLPFFRKRFPVSATQTSDEEKLARIGLESMKKAEEEEKAEAERQQVVQSKVAQLKAKMLQSQTEGKKDSEAFTSTTVAKGPENTKKKIAANTATPNSKTVPCATPKKTSTPKTTAAKRLAPLTNIRHSPPCPSTSTHEPTPVTRLVSDDAQKRTRTNSSTDAEVKKRKTDSGEANQSLKDIIAKRGKNWMLKMIEQKTNNTGSTACDKLFTQMVKRHREDQLNVIRSNHAQADKAETVHADYEIELKDLPDPMITRIMDLVEKAPVPITPQSSTEDDEIEEGEITEDDKMDDIDIMEIPLPPKPPVPIVTIGDDNEWSDGECEIDSQSQSLTEAAQEIYLTQSQDVDNGNTANKDFAIDLVDDIVEKVIASSTATAEPLVPFTNRDQSQSQSSPVLLDCDDVVTEVENRQSYSTQCNILQTPTSSDMANVQFQLKFQLLKDYSIEEQKLMSELDEIEKRRMEIMDDLKALRNKQQVVINAGAEM